MKLHVYNGPLPLLPPYLQLTDSSGEGKVAIDLDEVLARLIEEERLTRARARGSVQDINTTSLGS